MNHHAPVSWGVDCRVCGAQIQFVDRLGGGEDAPLARNLLCQECGNAERYASEEFSRQGRWAEAL